MPRVLGDSALRIFTVARLIKVRERVIAETFIIGRLGDSVRGQSNIRHERQLISVEYRPLRSGICAYCISFFVNEETISASDEETMTALARGLIDLWVTKNESHS